MTKKKKRIRDSFRIEDTVAKVKDIEDFATGLSVPELKTLQDNIIRDMRAMNEAMKNEGGVSRDRYRQLGKYTEAEVTKAFGTWNTAMRCAGLRPARDTKRVMNQIGLSVDYEKLRTASVERLNWGNEFTRPDNNERFKVIVTASDIHDIDVDPFALRIFYKALEEVNPDVICFNGDIFSLPEFSKYTRDPRTFNPGKSATVAYEIMAGARERCPDATIDLIEGNHEARLIKYLVATANPVLDFLHEFHGMNLRQLLRLNELEINYIAEGDLCIPDHKVDAGQLKARKIYYNTFMAMHFPPTGKNPPIMPGTNGHHHKYQVRSMYNDIHGSFTWVQTGALCKRQVEWADVSNWNTGFLITIVDTLTRSVINDYIEIGTAGAMLNGVWYERARREFYPVIGEEMRFQENYWDTQSMNTKDEEERKD